MRVAPFGHPRISGYVLLPAAFRSLSRPSSAPSAKASALCSSSLDHFVWLITIRLSHPDTSVYQDAALLPTLSHVQGLSFAFTRLLKTLICYFLILLRNNTSRCLLSFVCAFPRQFCLILHCLWIDAFVYAVFKVRPCLLFPDFLSGLAAACSPAPSPVQYHRPAGS